MESPSEAEPASALQRRRTQRGASFPRVALLLFDARGPEVVEALLQTLPAEVRSCLEEVLVLQGEGWREVETPRSVLVGKRPRVRLRRLPRGARPGAARKDAFEDALRSGFDLVVQMQADLHPAAKLTQLLYAAIVEEAPLVVGVREASGARRRAARADRAAGALLRRILGLALRDPLSRYRVVATRLLRRLPFRLCADDERFDAHLLIQCRALGVRFTGVELGETWTENARPAQNLYRVTAACAAALDYRLHQLHAVRRGRYLLDDELGYRFKPAETSSHMQIVRRVRPGSHVLDLGCSQGLLAAPLRDKGVQVTGVDVRPAAEVEEAFDAYYERDLEEPLTLPTGRVFDYVILADVIEHLRNRATLLRSARRYLKEGGQLIVSTPNIALWFYRLSLLVGRFEYGPRGVLDRTHVHLYTRATIRRELEGAGFRIRAERPTALPFEIVFESTGRSRLIRLACRGYHALARLWPEMFAYQIILAAEIATLDDEASTVPASAWSEPALPSASHEG